MSNEKASTGPRDATLTAHQRSQLAQLCSCLKGQNVVISRRDGTGSPSVLEDDGNGINDPPLQQDRLAAALERLSHARRIRERLEEAQVSAENARTDLGLPQAQEYAKQLNLEHKTDILDLAALTKQVKGQEGDLSEHSKDLGRTDSPSDGSGAELVVRQHLERMYEEEQLMRSQQRSNEFQPTSTKATAATRMTFPNTFHRQPPSTTESRKRPAAALEKPLKFVQKIPEGTKLPKAHRVSLKDPPVS